MDSAVKNGIHYCECDCHGRPRRAMGRYPLTTAQGIVYAWLCYRCRNAWERAERESSFVHQTLEGTK